MHLRERIKPDQLHATYKWRLVDPLFAWYARSKLKNKDFSLLCNNCFAGGIYHKFHLQYNTPTIWTYIYPEEYIRLLENLPFYLAQPLEFTTHTKHPLACTLNGSKCTNYPIGVLGGEIEIHFMHYASEKAAMQKWGQRLRRFNQNNLFVMFSLDRGWFEDSAMNSALMQELLERFEKLPYQNKLFFSPKPLTTCKSAVYIKDCINSPFIFDYTRNRKYEKYVDLTKWFNHEPDFLK